jgi:hypothetical protein
MRFNVIPLKKTSGPHAQTSFVNMGASVIKKIQINQLLAGQTSSIYRPFPPQLDPISHQACKPPQK